MPGAVAAPVPDDSGGGRLGGRPRRDLTGGGAGSASEDSEDSEEDEDSAGRSWGPPDPAAMKRRETTKCMLASIVPNKPADARIAFLHLFTETTRSAEALKRVPSSIDKIKKLVCGT